MDSLNPLVRLFSFLYGDFLAPKWVGLAMGAVSAVGGIADAFGGGDDGPGDTGAMNKWHLAQADRWWQEANLQNKLAAQTLAGVAGPASQDIYNRGMGFNWQPYLQASQQAGDVYTGLAPLYTQYGDRFAGMGDSAIRQAQNIYDLSNQMWQQAADPQNRLRERLSHQTQQQSRAASTARGLGTSPYASGLESQALSNFDIDWENNLLNRMGLGMQGLDIGARGALAANQTAGNDYTTALGLYQMAPQMLQQGALAPLQGLQTQLGYQQGLLNNYGQSVQQNQMNPLTAFQQLQIPYLNQGQGAMQSANWNRAFDAQQQASGMNALFQGLGQISDAWNGGSFGQWGGGGGGGGSSLSDVWANTTPAQWSAKFGYS